MALSITKKNRYVPQFNGNKDLPEAEQISVAYTTMSVQDVMQLQEQTGVNILTGDQSGDKDAFTTNWTVMQAVLNKYCTDWRNIIVDGVTLSESSAVLEALSLRYLTLFGEIFQFILVASAGTEDDVKNFVPGSVQTAPEPGTTVEPVPQTNSESETVEAAI